MSIRFNEEKQKVIQKLKYFLSKLSEIESKFFIDMSDFKSKVNSSIENVKNDVFSIAFFGAFSDGKSTILSVLIDDLEIDISPEPTTDRIVQYKYEDYQIIDTPGLFSENFMHDELTKKYISEANIIIYTVDPVNPLKKSHSDTLKWILKDLNKIEATIFVINKMDEVADLEDDEDFQENAAIKKKVVSDIIKELIGVDTDLKIVCIAADPYGLGLRYWKEREDEYRKLSRIDDLRLMISNFKAKYKNDLMLKAGFSVIQDVINQTNLELSNIKKSLTNEIKILNSQINEYENRLNMLKNNIKRCYINIKEDLMSLRNDLLSDIDSASDMQELCRVLQNRVGKDGYIIEERIDLIIKKHTESFLYESNKMLEELEESLIYHSRVREELMETLSNTGKSVIKTILSAPTRKIADAIIKVRDVMKIPIKFKPWGAIKVAKVFKVMPVVMEFVEFVWKYTSKKKLESKSSEIKNELENYFKKLIEDMTLESYTMNYFPFVKEVESILISLKQSKRKLQESLLTIDELNRDLKMISFDNPKVLNWS